MTTPYAIIIGAFIIGASLIGARFMNHYEIAPGSDAAGTAMLWRLNTITGEVQICPMISVVKDKNPFNKFAPDARPPCE